MYSPSLISAMVHAAWTNDGPPRGEPWGAYIKELPEKFAMLRVSEELPLVGRFDPKKAREPIWQAFEGISIDDGHKRSLAFWGWQPLSALARHLQRTAMVQPSDEYLELGTPTKLSARTRAFDAEQCCRDLLPLTAGGHSSARVVVAVVDRGVESPADTFGGKVEYVAPDPTTWPELSLGAHAQEVLATLLERLRERGALAQTSIVCSLVPEATNPIADDPLKQDNTVEMLSALMAASRALDARSLPSVVNLSMGTHVGPHNGDSTLEKQVSALTVLPNSGRPARFVTVSAGNDGGGGVHIERELEAGAPELVSLLVGPSGTRQLIVEFWWKDVPTVDIEFEVEVRPQGSSSSRFPGSLALSSNAPQLMTGIEHPNGLRQSLVALRCLNNLSCMAFALSHDNPNVLASLQVDFTLAAATCTTVHGWVIACNDEQATFKAASPDATLCVPATAPGVIAVASLSADGVPWKGSSRGPAVNYELGLSGNSSPQIAHLGSLHAGVPPATSYASARAAADIAALLAQPGSAGRCFDRESLLVSLLGGRSLGKWSSRTGYGRVLV
jgi:hypothetical protein